MEKRVLSTVTANRIADELLEQARSSRFGFTDPAGIPVAPLYRCRDLERLPQGLQLEIVDRANRETSATPLFIAAITAWVLSIAAVYIVQPAVFSERMLPPGCSSWRRSLPCCSGRCWCGARSG